MYENRYKAVVIISDFDFYFQCHVINESILKHEFDYRLTFSWFRHKSCAHYDKRKIIEPCAQIGTR